MQNNIGKNRCRVRLCRSNCSKCLCSHRSAFSYRSKRNTISKYYVHVIKLKWGDAYCYFFSLSFSHSLSFIWIHTLGCSTKKSFFSFESVHFLNRVHPVNIFLFHFFIRFTFFVFTTWAIIIESRKSKTQSKKREGESEKMKQKSKLMCFACSLCFI